MVVEDLVLWVVSPLGDVEGEREAFEDVEAAEGVVLAHVVEQGLLVADVVVLLEVVVEQEPAAVFDPCDALPHQHV